MDSSMHAPARVLANMPAIGTRVTIVLASGLRYSGTLTGVDTERDVFVTLRDVDFHGSEGRKTTSKFEFQAKSNIADFMRFQGRQIVNVKKIDDKTVANSKPIPISPASDATTSSNGGPPIQAQPGGLPEAEKRLRPTRKEREAAQRERSLRAQQAKEAREMKDWDIVEDDEDWEMV